MKYTIQIKFGEEWIILKKIIKYCAFLRKIWNVTAFLQKCLSWCSLSTISNRKYSRAPPFEKQQENKHDAPYSLWQVGFIRRGKREGTIQLFFKEKKTRGEFLDGIFTILWIINQSINKYEESYHHSAQLREFQHWGGMQCNGLPSSEQPPSSFVVLECSKFVTFDHRSLSHIRARTGALLTPTTHPLCGPVREKSHFNRYHGWTRVCGYVRGSVK